VSQLPDVVPEERHDRAVARDPVHVDLRAAHHEVGVDGRDVDALDHAAFHSLRVRAPVGDVARRVLVEERVEEGETRLPDARGAVHERDLAEVRRPLVRGELAFDHLGALLRLHLDDPAVLETQLEALHDPAVESERACRADDAFGAAQVGGGEGLLGGHVRDVRDSVRRDRLDALPPRLGQEPDT
jgi:hypothetical protein